MAEGLSVKPARAISWSEVDDRESTLIERCALGDEHACAVLVDEHQRMVYQLALHLLGDHNEALDLSQEVFLSVFRTIHRFRGSRPSGPGSSVSSSIRPAIASAGGAGAAGRSRSRSTSSSPRTATCRRRATRRRPTGCSDRRNWRPASSRRSTSCRSSSARPSSCARSTGSATMRSPTRWVSPSAR